jgi:hypothetical protein
MAHRVHPSMNAVQPAVYDSPPNGRVIEPELRELPRAHHPVLAGRQRSKWGP